MKSTVGLPAYRFASCLSTDPQNQTSFVSHCGFPKSLDFRTFHSRSKTQVKMPRSADRAPEGGTVKKIVRLLIAVMLLIGAVSTTSFADGGSPLPTCSPGHCPVNGGRQARRKPRL